MGLVSLVAQMVKTLPAMQETRVPSPGGEDPLEKEMATHSSILAWRIPYRQRSLAGYSLWGRKQSDTTVQGIPASNLLFRADYQCLKIRRAYMKSSFLASLRKM